eukprot:GFUD01042909.1.p1 GENE.GFUD01042909.1~~GFUD01042909.1.p1  ORF type:complete len:110 (+),score=34.01 GFUD01042909.1:208-537(+)
METDQDALNRKEKQLAYGKNTMDYDKYAKLVRKEDRKDRMPRTPEGNRKYSRRKWDGLVKTWKQQIHATITALEGVAEGLGLSIFSSGATTPRERMDSGDIKDCFRNLQ